MLFFVVFIELFWAVVCLPFCSVVSFCQLVFSVPEDYICIDLMLHIFLYLIVAFFDIFWAFFCCCIFVDFIVVFCDTLIHLGFAFFHN